MGNMVKQDEESRSRDQVSLPANLTSFPLYSSFTTFSRTSRATIVKVKFLGVANKLEHFPDTEQD